MKLLYDLFPIILFFVSYHQAQTIIELTNTAQFIDVSQPEQIVATIVATSIAIIASFIQVAGFWFKHRRFERMHIFSLTLITVLGSVTILLGDPTFIQWKPTLLNWAFALAFFGSQFIGKKSMVQRMMGGQISLPDNIWVRLNLSWVIFFIFSGAANLYVAFYYGLDQDEKTRMDFWVNFKLFGLMGLTFLFVIAQAFYLSKYMQEDSAEKNES